jgi:CBS domain-containing protein/PII-like signaling protein
MRGKRMTVFVGEHDQWRHEPLHLAVLEYLKDHGCAGATVTRGIAGFGSHTRGTASVLVEIPSDLPIVVTVVDQPEKIDEYARHVAGMLSGGAIAVEDTDVQFCAVAFQGGLPDVAVADVMTRTPDVVSPGTPLATLVQTLLESDHTVLPVVDADRRVLGVIGDHDLLRAGVTSASLSLHRVADPTTLAALLRDLGARSGVVGDAMTTPAITVRETARLRDAAHLMHMRGVKRLPVVDARDRLVGVLARLDILSRIAAGHPRPTSTRGHALPLEHRRVSEVMDASAPAVTETTPLADVVATLLDSDAKRIVVVDDVGRLAGVIVDTDILARVEPEERPSVFTMLRSRWSRDADRRVRRVYGQRAADVMTSPALSVRDDAPVIEALRISALHHVKRLPVVDADGRPIGMVSRLALLAASLDLASDPTHSH